MAINSRPNAMTKTTQLVVTPESKPGALATLCRTLAVQGGDADTAQRVLGM